MSNTFYKDNFFVIDSNNLGDVQNKLYGYAFFNDRILINSSECNTDIPNDTYGCYVNIEVKNKKIVISQDYFGSYGIYYFIKDNYFAFSNSFLFLVEYLYKKYELTFDDEFAKAFLGQPQAVLTYTDTMVKEINLFSRNKKIIIDIGTKTFSVETIEQKESYIPINTKEAIKIIDDWHNKWNTIINTLIRGNYPFNFSISGGKDSRVALACLVKPRLNLENVYFYCSTDGKYTHSDDFRIASEIARIYNFKLNEGDQVESYHISPVNILKSSFYAKCGYHREIMPKTNWRKIPEYTLTGGGGEMIRAHWEDTSEDFIDDACNYTVYNTLDAATSLRTLMNSTKDEIDRDLVNTANFSGNDYFYKQCRQRYHIGKGSVETFLSNQIFISPLLDPSLYKISQKIGLDNDMDLLYRLIYTRYLPELDNLDFDSNRIVIPETKKIADEINKKYPLSATDTSETLELKIHFSRIAQDSYNGDQNAFDYFKETFESKEVKNFVYKEFGEETYRRAELYYTKDYHPYIAASGLVQCYVISCLTEQSKKDNNVDRLFPQLEPPLKPVNYYNNGILKSIFNYLNSARIDINNTGSVSNKIELLESSDEKLYVEDHFIDRAGNKQAMYLQSYKGTLTITFKVVEDGKICIKLKGPWKRSIMSKKPLPLKIDYLSAKLENLMTGKIINEFSTIETVDSFTVKSMDFDCHKGDSFKLSLAWLPFAYSEQELSELIHELYSLNKSQFDFWEGNFKKNLSYT